MTIKLYHLPVEEDFGAHPRKVLIAINELNLYYIGVPVPREQVRYGRLAAHPNRKVPILEDDGIQIVESTAILLYLVDKYDKEHKLLSLDTQSKANTLTWISLQITGLAISVWNFATSEEGSNAKKRFHNEALHYYQLLDNRLATSESGYIVNAGFSIADICWITFVDQYRLNLLHLQDWSRYPHVDKWRRLVRSRPAVVKSYAITPGSPPALAKL